jgi:hypothetical protein
MEIAAKTTQPTQGNMTHFDLIPSCFFRRD